ncbi:hypothetical protein NX801_28565 [Streptomyces sp. LP05-1]|uniref:Uncharacterized protein n=1 Tax=Streptomyces pyxinae TaxID=2970734 RepID=A0ABT2CQ05_9ACTN|nr:hypothetical protein [Streptomyces sp. LP05-1]MCS0639518.1 hypothetical protein [Streptomyces sp. LP05-1]
MAKEKGHPEHGEGPTRHQGKQQHGWSPDIDDQKQQDNPSGHRSFHTETYAGEKKASRRSASEREKEESLRGTPLESGTKSGEDRPEKSAGMRDTGRRGRSGRPSGSKDDTAYTGIDPKGPPAEDGSR